MKKVILLLAAIFLGYANTNAQSCLPQGIIFSAQVQIDSFQTHYPGCTEIEGDVKIDGGNITNLHGLSVITYIGGDLTIGGGYYSNPLLTSLTGLKNLTSIGGDFEIIFNNNLIGFQGLHNLTSLGGNFCVSAKGACLHRRKACVFISYFHKCLLFLFIFNTLGAC